MQTHEIRDHDEAFMRRIVVVFGRQQEMTFDDVIRQYRQIEAEFVALAGDNEVLILQRQQTITNHLLMEAQNAEQPHEVCHAIWEELKQRGFNSIETRHSLSSTYIRCCQWNGEFHAGLGVVEPLIAELEVQLAQADITPNYIEFCKQFLDIHRETREELIAGIRERLVPHSGMLGPEEIALTQRINAIRMRECKDDLSFAEAMHKYREIESEFVERAANDHAVVAATKQRVTESILRSAYETAQPHEVCQPIWDELVKRGFSNLERRHYMSGTYVECCRFNGEFAVGLVVLEPLIMELEQCLDSETTTAKMHNFCETWLKSHRTLRDKLQRGIR